MIRNVRWKTFFLLFWLVVTVVRSIWMLIQHESSITQGPFRSMDNDSHHNIDFVSPTTPTTTQSPPFDYNSTIKQKLLSPQSVSSSTKTTDKSTVRRQDKLSLISLTTTRIPADYDNASISSNNTNNNIHSTRTTSSTTNLKEFPITKFTSHVKEIVSNMKTTTTTTMDGALDYHPERCKYWVQVTIGQEPYTPPINVTCNTEYYYCRLIKNLFFNMDSFTMPITPTTSTATKVLPYNITIGFSNADMIKSNSKPAWKHCLASSSENGIFAMTNFENVKDQIMNISGNVNNDGYVHNPILKWEQRSTVPIFRGHPRPKYRDKWKRLPERYCVQKLNASQGSYGRRIQLVQFAFDNPELIDAACYHKSIRKHPCMQVSNRNGWDRLFRVGKYSSNRIAKTKKRILMYQNQQQQQNNVTTLHENKYNTTNTKDTPFISPTSFWSSQLDRPLSIPPSKYYTEYQVAIVLGGIGAAFRLSKHFSAGQAVILQDYQYQEWFTPYLVPYRHYVPLKRDLSNVREQMIWVRDHPLQVKQIAEAGKLFYDEYLSFEPTYQHFYELLWRMSERQQQQQMMNIKHINKPNAEQRH